MSAPVELQKRVACDLGAFVQAAAKLEKDIDYLFALSLDAVKQEVLALSPKPPTGLEKKVDLVFRLFGEEPFIFDDRAAEFLGNFRPEEFKELFAKRNIVCHGKIVDIKPKENGYVVTFAKFSRPRKAGVKRVLDYKTEEIDSQEIFDGIVKTQRMQSGIEELRNAAWDQLKGWPKVINPFEGDPFDPFEVVQPLA